MFWLTKQYVRLEDLWVRGSRRKRFLIYLCAYTVVFLLTFLLAYSPFLLDGKSFIWASDGRSQHYPLLVYIGRSIRKFFLGIFHGEFAVPLFDLNLGLGSDIVGYLNSLGLNDPLMLFAALIPTKYMEIFYGFLTIFRVYLAGLSFAFLCRNFKRPVLHTLIGCVIYCFSGYAILCAMRHPFFIIPMVQLPLLVVGLDKILKREKPYLFIFAIFYAGLCEYYHLYMMTILLLLYALIRFFDLYREDRMKQFFGALGRATGSYALGIGLSAVVFLPSAIAFLGASRSGFSNYNGSYAWSWYRARLLRFIAPPGSWDDMAFAAIVLFALVLLFCSKRKRALKCISFAVLLIYFTSIGSLVMNGFQYSSNRWTFGLVLVMAFVTVDLLPDLLSLSVKNRMACVLILCAYAVFALTTSVARKTTYVLVGLLFLALTLLALTFPLGSAWESVQEEAGTTVKKMTRYSRIIVCLLLVICNVGVNGIYKFAADQANYSGEFKELGYETKRLEGAIEREMEPYLLNNPEGRADSISFTVNTAMVWRIPGMLTYNSVENGNVINFWNNIENSGSKQAFLIWSTGQQTIATTLLSEKYHVESESGKSYVPYGYSLIKQTDQGNLIYENQYALPWGYTYDNVISYDDMNGMNGLQKQEAMLQSIALDDADIGLETKPILLSEQAIPYEITYTNCTWENGELAVNKANATIKLIFDMPAGVEGYVRLSRFDINDSGLSNFDITVKCGNISRTSRAESHLYTWYFGRENYLFNLGYSDEERTELTITFPSKGTFKLSDIELYALPMDGYADQVEALRAEPLENIEWGTNRLTGTVDLSSEKILCMSIPYSAGWSAKVDGEKVEILRGNYMFMAIPLAEGHHDVEFNYCSPGLRLGIVTSIVCCGIVLGMLRHDKGKQKNLKPRSVSEDKK